MANGIRTGDPRAFNKGRGSKFREGSRYIDIYDFDLLAFMVYQPL